jgi:hypothetical protein
LTLNTAITISGSIVIPYSSTSNNYIVTGLETGRGAVADLVVATLVYNTNEMVLYAVTPNTVNYHIGDTIDSFSFSNFTLMRSNN